MSVQTIAIIAVIAMVAYFILQNGKKYEPRDEECARDVIAYLKGHQNISAKEIAEIYKRHNRTANDIDRVTTLVKAQLSRAGIRKEEHTDVMNEVRNAKRYLGNKS